MRKRIAFVAVLLVMTLCAACALGAGVTLRVFTPFADMDAAAQSYMDMITAWEEETGNVVEDYSGLMDDAWMETMLSMVREVVFGVGFALLLPCFFSLNGVLYSMPVSDVLTFVLSAILIVRTRRSLKAGFGPVPERANA